MSEITVNMEALGRVLEALNGPWHLIRELQATRGPLVGDDNPINILINEYNNYTKKSEKETLANVRLSCGRIYLEVAGIVVAVQGDKCRSSSEFPEEILPQIPDEELKNATIGGKSAKDVPLDVIRFFRGECWTEKMLEYAADRINNG